MDEEFEKLKRAWEYHKAADEMLHQRMNFGMVAHSMLLVAFVTVFVNYKLCTELFIEIIICVFGIYYSFHQKNRIKGLEKRLDYLKNYYLKPIDYVYRAYMRQAPDKGWRHSQTACVLIVFWFILLAISLLKPVISLA